MLLFLLAVHLQLLLVLLVLCRKTLHLGLQHHDMLSQRLRQHGILFLNAINCLGLAFRGFFEFRDSLVALFEFHEQRRAGRLLLYNLALQLLFAQFLHMDVVHSCFLLLLELLDVLNKSGELHL